MASVVVSLEVLVPDFDLCPFRLGTCGVIDQTLLNNKRRLALANNGLQCGFRYMLL